MKKIILVGKLNNAVKELNNFLAQHFTVQLCSDSAPVLDGMMKIVHPDLVLISLIGAYGSDSSLFFLLHDKYEEVPVLTIGTKEECGGFTKYYEEAQFQNLVRPIENSAIYKAICDRLAMVPDAAVAMQEEPEQESTKKRILVVDDNGVQLRTMKAMLSDRYEVAVAISGTQAMTSIGKQRPDLILLDYEMPVCDGKQTFEMIRAEKELADIPVIFLTGVNDRAHIEAVLSLHPAGYLLKPPVKERLIKEIEDVLGEDA